MTGKTSLALLTERHLRKTHDENDLRIVRISGAWLDQSLGFDALFRKVMGNTSWSEFVEECLIIKTVFILDEAQVDCIPMKDGALVLPYVVFLIKLVVEFVD
ncbi:hypothetical protein BZG36_04317, partial [Bifiguratus adelaidae]